VTPAVTRLTTELIAAVHVLKALHEPGVVVSIERRSARARMFALADKLEAELSRPIGEVIARQEPWSPHNPRNAL
jgi:hypothetical protein